MKPEPPPYPRPVPSIDFDEDPILPGTIIYTAENETDPTERAAKRRRIEDHAHAYLRGEGVFILTAGLRGPFDAGWKNPWAAGSKKRKLINRVEERSPKRVHLTSGSTKHVPRSSHIHAEQKSKNVAAPENPFERTIRSSEPPAHNEKVESWLRRNSGFAQDSFTAPATPTPKKIVSMEKDDAMRPIWTPTKQKITVNSQDIKAPIQQPVSRVPDSFETIIPPGQIPANPGETHAKLQTALHDGSYTFGVEQHDRQPSLSTGRSPSIGKHTDPHSRAEDAIAEIKRKPNDISHQHSTGRSPVQNGDPALGQILRNGDTKQMGPPNGMVLKKRRVSEQAKPASSNDPAMQKVESRNRTKEPIVVEVKLKRLESVVDQQLQENEQSRDQGEPKEADVPTTTGVTVPFHSTAVSEVQSTKLPPSAQHKPELQLSTSNISSGALLPDVPTGTGALGNVPSETQVARTENEILAPDSNAPSQEQGHPDNAALGNDSITSINIDDQKRDDLEGPKNQILAEPKNPSTSNIPRSPSCEITNNTRLSQTNLNGCVVKSPGSAKRPKTSSKKVKKTSFASEAGANSSFGSIKDVLKVQKSDMRDKAQKLASHAELPSKTPLSSSAPEKGSVMADKQRSISSLANSPVEVKKPRRSILKQISTHSSAAAALASAMVSPRDRLGSANQDIMVSGQNGLILHQQDEDFDMEGALDDLGSFLSTWDAEKEKIHVA